MTDITIVPVSDISLTINDGTSDIVLQIPQTSEIVINNSVGQGPAGLTGATGNPGAAAFRNVLINGGMRVSKRATVFSNPTNGQYLIDRWRVGFNGTGATRSITQQLITGGADIEGTLYFLRFDQTAAGTAATQNDLQQRVEGVETLNGKTITISFYARANSNTTIRGASLQQNFGVGGSTEVSTSIMGSTLITTSWQRYVATASLPNILSKTVGTSSYLQLSLLMPLNTTFQVDITAVQLEGDSVASNFEKVPLALETTNCARFFQLSAPRDNFGISNTTTSGLMKGFFSTPMRVPPTATLSVGNTITIDFFGLGSSTSTSYSLLTSVNVLSIDVNTLSPARTAQIPIQSLTQISLDAEL